MTASEKCSSENLPLTEAVYYGRRSKAQKHVADDQQVKSIVLSSKPSNPNPHPNAFYDR